MDFERGGDDESEPDGDRCRADGAGSDCRGRDSRVTGSRDGETPRYQSRDIETRRLQVYLLIGTDPTAYTGVT